MNVAMNIHMELADDDIVWWAETEAVPGLSVAAPTLRELRALIDEAVARYVDHSVVLSLELVADVAGADSESYGGLGVDRPELPVAALPPLRSTVVSRVA